MPTEVRHRMTNQRYALLDDGSVKVVDDSSGQHGVFRANGDWVSGELKHADRHMLEWVTR